MSYRVITNPKVIDDMMNENVLYAKKKDLENYIKCVSKNLFRFDALTDYYVVDGYNLEPQLCAEILPEVLGLISRDFIKIILNNPNINGKTNNFSTGGFGSIWMDMDAEKYDLDYIRVAFYSKKFEKNWRHSKPYAIRITCEKANE